MAASFVTKFQYLTFDCYGTLIDWRKGIEAHLGELLRKNGVVPKKKIFPIYVKYEAEEESESKPYRKVLKNTAMRIASHFGMSVPEEQAEEFAESVPYWTPFSDTTETLKELGREDTGASSYRMLTEICSERLSKEMAWRLTDSSPLKMLDRTNRRLVIGTLSWSDTGPVRRTHFTLHRVYIMTSFPRPSLVSM